MKKLIAGALSGILFTGIIWTGGDIINKTKETVGYLTNVIVDQDQEIMRLEDEAEKANNDAESLKDFILNEKEKLPKGVKREVNNIWKNKN